MAALGREKMKQLEAQYKKILADYIVNQTEKIYILLKISHVS